MTNKKKQPNIIKFDNVFTNFIVLVIAGIISLITVIINNAKGQLFSSSIVTIIFLISIFFTSINKDMKDKDIWQRIVFILYIIYFLLTAYLLASSIFILSILLIAMFIFYNTINPEKAIAYETIIIIVLAFITLEINQPLLKPKIDVQDIGQIKQGEIYEDGTYGLREYTVLITPPLISTTCTNINLAYNTRKIYVANSDFNIPKLRNGETIFCTDQGEFTKRVKKFNLLSEQHISFQIYGQNISTLSLAKPDNNILRIARLTIINNEKFPIYFFNNMTITITNESKLDEDIYLREYILSNKNITDCLLNNIYLGSQINSGSYLTNYTILEDRIILKFDTTIRVESQNITTEYIQFEPYACQ